MTSSRYDAIVLAGGASRRMNGVDKTALAVAGRPLLDHVLAAVADADNVVVVGPPRPTTTTVVWRREDPPGGGPAAAIAAAIPATGNEIAAVVAGDQPLLTADAVRLLVTTLGRDLDVDGAVATDEEGRPQWLLGAWRIEALGRAQLTAGASLRDTLGALRWMGVPAPAGSTADCDTPDDVRRVERMLLERSRR
jgi:molybdopterin-guanine dinucleotide biosynthesis protein A